MGVLIDHSAGDIAHMVNHPRPKAGVFAVREGPPLDINLRRSLQGLALVPFTPQSTFLSLISTGEKYCVGSKGPFSFEGAYLWTLKDWIDRKFMRMYQVSDHHRIYHAGATSGDCEEW